MLGKTLVVIDMQPRFSASAEVLDQVLEEVRLANQRKAGVIVVEYKSPSYKPSEAMTWPAIYEACQWKSGRAIIARKAYDDGSDEVLAALDDAGFNKERVRVVGVNRNACVQSTVVGMFEKQTDMQIELGWKATANNWQSEESRDLEAFQKMVDTGRLKIIF